ncbi:hypothetical protein BN381_50049 [Candidatus Microthrix parvicella RN1]|jgi:hypothetical protein|uniref:Uncharacterized protein n=1 Tax=Candidatus Neomicrothrix parvicella RN1 TaxID=1229780 RepID=R4Z6X8_9ACTN|nr:hypothetical protein BN381_50049 [Candidatus Microthrix parvicella RN1]
MPGSVPGVGFTNLFEFRSDTSNLEQAIRPSAAGVFAHRLKVRIDMLESPTAQGPRK